MLDGSLLLVVYQLPHILPFLLVLLPPHHLEVSHLLHFSFPIPCNISNHDTRAGIPLGIHEERTRFLGDSLQLVQTPFRNECGNLLLLGKGSVVQQVAYLLYLLLTLIENVNTFAHLISSATGKVVFVYIIEIIYSLDVLVKYWSVFEIASWKDVH